MHYNSLLITIIALLTLLAGQISAQQCCAYPSGCFKGGPGGCTPPLVSSQCCKSGSAQEQPSREIMLASCYELLAKEKERTGGPGL